MKSHLNLNYTVWPEHSLPSSFRSKGKPIKCFACRHQLWCWSSACSFKPRSIKSRVDRTSIDIKLFCVLSTQQILIAIRCCVFRSRNIFVFHIFFFFNTLKKGCFVHSGLTQSGYSLTSCKPGNESFWYGLFYVTNERCCVMNFNQVSPWEPLFIQHRQRERRCRVPSGIENHVITLLWNLWNCNSPSSAVQGYFALSFSIKTRRDHWRAFLMYTITIKRKTVIIMANNVPPVSESVLWTYVNSCHHSTCETSTFMSH